MNWVLAELINPSWFWQLNICFIGKLPCDLLSQNKPLEDSDLRSNFHLHAYQQHLANHLAAPHIHPSLLMRSLFTSLMLRFCYRNQSNNKRCLKQRSSDVREHNTDKLQQTCNSRLQSFSCYHVKETGLEIGDHQFNYD